MPLDRQGDKVKAKHHADDSSAIGTTLPLSPEL